MFLRPSGEKERAGLFYLSADVLPEGDGQCCLSASLTLVPGVLALSQALFLCFLREGAEADALTGSLGLSAREKQLLRQASSWPCHCPPLLVVT